MSSDRIVMHLRRGREIVSILLCALLPHALFSQDVDVDVRGGFLSDSLRIGDETAYYLSAHYPSDLTVLFPDSVHGFEPFEYLRREYFPTKTTEGLSADSTVYYLTTFEVDRLQYLRLPVYLVRAGDSTIVETEADSVLITQFVAQVPDTVTVDQLPLRMNTAYEKVVYNLNFWMIVIIGGGFLVLAIIAWLLFGKKIKRYFQARKLQKNHASFLERYNTLLRQLQTTFSSPATESALVTWKRYMEQLESRPYTKLTTRETLRLIREPALSVPLAHVDKAIYGHDTSVVESLENLKSFADQRYKQKLKEVQHG